MNFTIFCLAILDAWTDILVFRNLKRNFYQGNSTKIPREIERPTSVLNHDYFDDPVVKNYMGNLGDFQKSISENPDISREDILDHQMIELTKLFKESARMASARNELDCKHFDLWDDVVKALFQKFEKQFGTFDYLEETKKKWFKRIDYGYGELDGRIFCHVSPDTFKFIKE